MAAKVLFSEKNSTTKFKNSNHFFRWRVDLKSINIDSTVVFYYSRLLVAKFSIEIPEDDVKINIKIDRSLSCYQFALCNFLLLDVEGKKRGSRRAVHLFETEETWEFPTFIKKSELLDNKYLYIKDGCFTLECYITVLEGSAEDDTENEKVYPLPSKPEFLDVNHSEVLLDIKRMYAQKIHTDINLKAGTELFPAHKSILCARSPVFLAMFDKDMAETQKGEVDISDLDAKTVDLFLEYVYTGTVNKLEYENVLKLIVAADKYHVLLLKNKCAHLLKSMLTDANVCEVLVIADLIHQDTLKAFVFDYIIKQPDKIFNSEEWKETVKNNFELATETLCEVSKLWGDQTKEQSAKSKSNDVLELSHFGAPTAAAPRKSSSRTNTPFSGSSLLRQPSAKLGGCVFTNSGGFGGTGQPSATFGEIAVPNRGGFGGGFSATATSGTTIKFNPSIGTDTIMKGGVSTTVKTRHQVVTSMEEYRNKSFEELRLEYYAANRKGGNVFIPNPSAKGFDFSSAAVSEPSCKFGSQTISSTAIATPFGSNFLSAAEEPKPSGFSIGSSFTSSGNQGELCMKLPRRFVKPIRKLKM